MQVCLILQEDLLKNSVNKFIGGGGGGSIGKWNLMLTNKTP